MTGERAEVANDDQEEVYFGLDGKAFLLLGDDGEVELTEGVMVRCGAEQTRQLITRDDSATVLAMGAMPGKTYTPRFHGTRRRRLSPARLGPPPMVPRRPAHRRRMPVKHKSGPRGRKNTALV